MPTNLQLQDTFNGGSFVFVRNDYPLDKGIYTELYCTFFTTKSDKWLGDNAFDVESPVVSSKTENALSTFDTFTETNKSLITKAIQQDLERFTTKNPEIIIKNINLVFYKNGVLRINIIIEGDSQEYDFLVAKTQTSLDNIDFDLITI